MIQASELRRVDTFRFDGLEVRPDDPCTPTPHLSFADGERLLRLLSALVRPATPP